MEPVGRVRVVRPRVEAMGRESDKGDDARGALPRDKTVRAVTILSCKCLATFPLGLLVRHVTICAEAHDIGR